MSCTLLMIIFLLQHHATTATNLVTSPGKIFFIESLVFDTVLVLLQGLPGIRSKDLLQLWENRTRISVSVILSTSN